MTTSAVSQINLFGTGQSASPNVKNEQNDSFSQIFASQAEGKEEATAQTPKTENVQNTKESSESEEVKEVEKNAETNDVQETSKEKRTKSIWKRRMKFFPKKKWKRR